MEQPPVTELDWTKQYRIVPARFPPINLFESILDPEDLELAYEIEGQTNDRLREKVGDLSVVAPEDRISGPGSSPVMAAFTHIGFPSRFSDGAYGVYYAGDTLDTAIAETRYHRARFFRFTQEPDTQIKMRVYIGEVIKPLHDIRDPAYGHLHHPDDYTPSQRFGAQLRRARSWGLVYHSVRHPGGQCIAAFRPPAISVPVQGPHLEYLWSARLQAIVDVLEVRELAV